MPIRFACPGCSQPLEVDEICGGKPVACPYCRRVVTAPAASTWPTGDIPVASPASTGVGSMAEPAPGAGGSPIAPPPLPAGGSRAVGAFVVSLAGAMMAAAAWMTVFGAMGVAILDQAGPRPTPQQQQAVMQEMLAKGQLIPRTAAVLFGVGILLSLTGLVLAIRSLVRPESRRGLAVAACILGACTVFCQVLPMLAAGLSPPGAPPG